MMKYLFRTIVLSIFVLPLFTSSVFAMSSCSKSYCCSTRNGDCENNGKACKKSSGLHSTCAGITCPCSACGKHEINGQCHNFQRCDNKSHCCSIDEKSGEYPICAPNLDKQCSWSPTNDSSCNNVKCSCSDCGLLQEKGHCVKRVL